ncbi:hypothetical protein SAMN05880501_10546 [Ureibacillus xyleni]|uniref:Uncharacterized protein n=1 Tax=Ureibacillus xyleni TaxID=614648 RepID=A0A285SJY7_9BACL|nr:hypothetical protein [Ureibacillus xyleni]SOC08242.1 hypothetical protein SAMN05880501_10546 [Ureibacillus xyleni]
MNTLQQNSTNFQSNPSIILQEQDQSDSINIIAELLMIAITKKHQLQKESA